MSRIFHWFYCLPLWCAACVVLLGTLVYRQIRGRLLEKNIRWPLVLLSGCWLAVILCATLGRTGQGGGAAEPVLIPFYSYYAALFAGQWELLRECFMNVALFYPAGLLARDLLPRKAWLVVLGSVLLSIGIELLQYRFSLGLPEVDDVIHNSLGVLLGYHASRVLK